MSEVPYRWATLQLHLGQDANLSVMIRSDEGRPRGQGTLLERHRRYHVGSIFDWPAGPLAESDEAAEYLSHIIAEALSVWPDVRPSGSRIMFPLFFRPAGVLPTAPWERLLRQWLEAAGAPHAVLERTRFVRLRHRTWKPRPLFRLPLIIQATDERANEALGAVRNERWYRDHIEVQEYGIRMTHARLTQSHFGAEVVMMTGGRKAIRKIRGAVAEKPPRLVVLLDGLHGSCLRPQDFLAGGTAILHLRARRDLPQAVLEIVLGIVHDIPLHEIAEVIATEVPSFRAGDASIELYADPESNQGLRMTDALGGMLREASELAARSPLGNVDDFLARLDARGGERGLETALARSRGVLARAGRRSEQVFDALRSTRHVAADFRRETSGMLPLARAEATIEDAKQEARKVEAALDQLLGNPEMFELARRLHARSVDARLEHIDDLTQQPIPTGDGRPFLASDTPLHAGKLYRLSVCIGRRTPDSLIEGDVPPLDPLLPRRAGGHALEITFYPLDFIAESRTYSVTLPPLGASEFATFQFRVPYEPVSASNVTAPLRLRFTIHHENHIVQSFLLEAFFDPPEGRHTDQPALRIRSEFSRSKQFANVDELGGRLMTFGFNEDPSGKTHTLMVKRNGIAGSVRLTEASMSKVIEESRRILTDAMNAKDGHDFLFAAEGSDTTPRQEHFEKTVRELATIGRKLFDALFGKMDNRVREELRAVRDAEDGILQAVRLEDGYAFPWSVVYDYDLPTMITGAPPPYVCQGYTLSNGVPQRCAHAPKEGKVVCARGFWGVRHRVEELLSAGSRGDAVRMVTRHRPEGALALAFGSSQARVARLPTDLQTMLPAGTVVTIVPPDDLLDVLWDEKRRPAQLVVLGHLGSKPVNGEPEGLRIQSHQQRWLLCSELNKRLVNDGDWEAPRPVVLLMACGSAATEVATLNDFLMSFSNAGAAAIVGTECQVTATLGARFTLDVTRDLWRCEELGRAVVSFRRRLLAEKNPLGFVFTPFGSTDVIISCPEE